MIVRKMFIVPLLTIFVMGCGGGGGATTQSGDESGTDSLAQKIRNAAAAIAAMQVVNNVNN